MVSLKFKMVSDYFMDVIQSISQTDFKMTPNKIFLTYSGMTQI